MKARPVIFCFSGQGAQYRHMARDLMAEDAVFRSWMEEGDALVRDGFGFSVIDEIHDPDHARGAPFDRLEATHPALFMVQHAAAKAMMARGLHPDLMLGVSLGEFVAMVLTGALGFDEALSRIARQPAMLAGVCPPARLISVLASSGLRDDDAVLADTTHLAGIGSPQNSVLAVEDRQLDDVINRLSVLGAPAQILPVPYGFHTALIAPSADACRAMFAEISVRAPDRPCLSSCLGAPVDPHVPELLWRIVREPMNVPAAVACAEAQCEPESGAAFIDLSPSGALAGLVRQNLAKGSPSRIALTLSPMGGNMARLDSVARRFSYR
jgi:bacillaene synthase trans-acting acyltransferase